MNAKQRRHFVRQYKERIHADMAICRLEGAMRWFDPKNPNYTYISPPGPYSEAFRYFVYALYLKATNETI